MFIGSSLVSDGLKLKVRQMLINECLKTGYPRCLVALLESADKIWLLPEGVANILEGISSPLLYYRMSHFCFMPKGATFSRKAFLDAILSGCMPVVFNIESCYLLYPVHLPLNVAKDVCVYYPAKAFEEDPTKLFDYLEMLKDSEEMEYRREVLYSVLGRLHYALQPSYSSQAIASVIEADGTFVTVETQKQDYSFDAVDTIFAFLKYI
jgi:hypothetical protein